MTSPLDVLREIVQDAVAEGLVNETEEEAANAVFAQLETLVEASRDTLPALVGWVEQQIAGNKLRAALRPFVDPDRESGA